MRLIDADAMIKRMNSDCLACETYLKNGSACFDCKITKVEKAINDTPTVDAVTVVRCGECTWWFKDENYDGLFRCANDGLLRKCDHYCSDGERKADA